MHLKKAATFLVAILFLASSFTVFADPAQGEARSPDKIRFEVRTVTTEPLIEDTALDDLDVFLDGISGSTYEGAPDDWKSELGTWKGTASYNDMYLNPTHDKDTGLPVVMTGSQYEFNPFGIRKVRFAVNHLMNRKHIVEDIYGGYAEPRYTAVGVNSPGYDQYIDTVVKDEPGLTYSGDFQKGYEMVQTSMRDMKEELENDTSIYGQDYGELRLSDPGSDAGKNNKWQYRPPGGNWSTIEIISYNRMEDERLQIGHYFIDQMDKCGFEGIDKERRIPLPGEHPLYGDPANMAWHGYTGGWLEEGTKKYQEETVNQMYAPWFGYMPGGLAGENAWQYENETLDKVGERLMNGRVPNENSYWDMMQKMVKTGVKESVRVFLSTPIEFYIYDKDRVANVATDVVAGWSSVFGPRTLQIDTTNDNVQAKFGQYSSTGALYLDNWNRIGGARDKYSKRQQDVVRDRATTTHPSSGEPMAMRADREVNKNFTWNGGEKEKNMNVPETAVRYDTESQRWKEVGSGQKSAVAVTYTWKKNDSGSLGTWHDGSPIHERDILAWYAFNKELSFDDGSEYYESRWASTHKPWFENITGVEWGEDDGTYTIYGNYTFPTDSKIGSYYGITPYKPWEINEAAQQMITNSSISASSDQSWGWTDAAENWIHFINEYQSDKFNTTMQNMVDQGWIPEYLKSENNCPLPITTSEMKKEIENITSFYQEYDHMFDSQGPFKLTNVDEANMIMEMERYSQSDGYPFPKDYWHSRLKSETFNLGTPDIPSFAFLGKDIPVKVKNCRIRQDYPILAIRPGDTGNVTFSLLNETEKITEVSGNHTTDGTFEAVIPGSATWDLDPGVYQIKISGKTSDSMPDTIIERIYFGDDKDVARVEEPQVTPKSGQIPLDIFIEGRVVNPSNYTVDVPIKIDGSMIENIDIDPDEVKNISIPYTIDQIGTYTVSMGDTADDVIGRSIHVTATNDSDIQVSGLAVDTEGMKLNISADVKNTANHSQDVKVEIGPKMEEMKIIETVNVEANSTQHISTVYEVNHTGEYKVLVKHQGSIVTVPEPKPEFEFVETLQVSKDGLKVTVMATVKNTGFKDGTIYIWADGEQIGNKTIGPGENHTFEVTHKFDSKGEYLISIKGHEGYTVDEKVIDVKKDEGDTPGLMLVFLVISVLAAALIYWKKRENGT